MSRESRRITRTTNESTEYLTLEPGTCFFLEADSEETDCCNLKLIIINDRQDIEVVLAFENCVPVGLIPLFRPRSDELLGKSVAERSEVLAKHASRALAHHSTLTLELSVLTSTREDAVLFSLTSGRFNTSVETPLRQLRNLFSLKQNETTTEEVADCDLTELARIR